MNINELKDIDIRTVDKSTLVDLESVKINSKESIERKMRAFVEQIKNPYCFICDGYVVKIEFNEKGKSIEECLAKYADTLG